MSKFPIIRALDVVPNQVYALPHGRTIIPVRIICTEHHGWQRGYVRLVYAQHVAVAIAQNALDLNEWFNVVLHRDHDEWLFLDGNYRTLQYLSPNWINDQLIHANQRMLKAQQEVARLLSLQDQLTF